MDEFKRTPKVKVSINVPKKDLELARAKDLNISAICRYALKLAIAGKLYKSDQKKV